jgi:uncharacterized cupredoxin-like copper-binding protein
MVRKALSLTVALGLLSTTGCATTHAITPQVASAADFSRAERLEVKLSDFAFTPATIRLHAGQPYALALVNAGSGAHDFTAPEFFAASRVAPEDGDRVAKGEVEVEAGRTATIHIIPAAGQYNLVCTHFGHALLGMKGKIIVS